MIEIKEAPIPNYVTLVDYEFRNAALIGFTRAVNSILKKSKSYFPEKYEGQTWHNNILGACGEAAVAKFLNVYWGGGVDTYNQSDLIGYPCEIRTTTHKVLKPKIRPKDSGIIIAVVADPKDKMRFKIWGWLDAQKGKQDEWYHADQDSLNPSPCWFPPLDVWHDMTTLPKESKND